MKSKAPLEKETIDDHEETMFMSNLEDELAYLVFISMLKNNILIIDKKPSNLYTNFIL